MQQRRYLVFGVIAAFIVIGILAYETPPPRTDLPQQAVVGGAPIPPPAPRPANPAVVSAGTWRDGQWPLMVSGGVLTCVQQAQGEAVFIVTDDGRMWPLNGTARQVHASFGAEPATEPIWRENPQIPGARINIRPLIDRARSLC